FLAAFDPTDGNKAVAHIIDYDFGTNEWFHQAVYSTNAGQTWSVAAGLSRVNGFGSRIEPAYAPSQPSIVYASAAAGGGAIWKSTDGGQSYTLQTTSGASGSSWYANPLWVDPTDPNVLLTGGYHIHRSMDGGVTLTQISTGYIMTAQAHPDIHFFTQDPGFDGATNRRVYVCTDGGVWATDNVYTVSSSSGWYRRDSDYRTTQFYGAAGDGPGGLIIGGTQDNGTLRLTTGSDDAHLTFGGDGGFCAVDPTNSSICYGEYVHLQIHRSLNGGGTASYIFSGIGDAGSDANFIAPFILDPNNPNRMLAGGRSLWRSNNVTSLAPAPSWSAIRGPGSDRISAIAAAAGNSDVVWIGQNNGEVHRTLNGTAGSPSWSAVDNNGGTNPLPNRYVTRILIDPNDVNTVYVSFGGFSPDNLYRTTNGGAIWTDVTGSGATGLPDAPINGIARHPASANWLYVATEVGIFASGDGGATWTTTNAGPANVSVDEVVFMHNSNTLLAATHGRGIFTVVVPEPCTLPGDVNGDGVADGDDVDGFVRVKLGTALPGDNALCANYGTGTTAGDAAAFAADLLN
ncbi:MAG: hypothetical protein V3T70_03595, partial [Phycisphaerae bacterium]